MNIYRKLLIAGVNVLIENGISLVPENCPEKGKIDCVIFGKPSLVMWDYLGSEYSIHVNWDGGYTDHKVKATGWFEVKTNRYVMGFGCRGMGRCYFRKFMKREVKAELKEILNAVSTPIPNGFLSEGKFIT